MDAELKARWIAALEGEYADRKGKNALHAKDGSMCCLGVVCDIQGVEWILRDGLFYQNGHSAVLHLLQNSSWGIKLDAEDELTKLNDESDTFAPVIEYIRENL